MFEEPIVAALAFQHNSVSVFATSPEPLSSEHGGIQKGVSKRRASLGAFPSGVCGGSSVPFCLAFVFWKLSCLAPADTFFLLIVLSISLMLAVKSVQQERNNLSVWCFPWFLMLGLLSNRKLRKTSLVCLFARDQDTYLRGQGLLPVFSCRSCARSPAESIVNRVREIGETFCHSYTQPTDELPGSHIGRKVKCVGCSRT